MSSVRDPRRIVVISLAVWIVAMVAETSRAQFLEPRKTAPAPEFRGVTQWISSEQLTIAKLRGKVVLV